LQQYCWNVCGIKNKIEELRESMLLKKMDVLGVAETFLGNDETVDVEGFKWIGNGRKNKKRGMKRFDAGVGFLIANYIDFSVVEHEEEEGEGSDECETGDMIWIKLEETGRNSLVLGTVYGPQETTCIMRLKILATIWTLSSWAILMHGLARRYQRNETLVCLERIKSQPTAECFWIL
jgi:hypothetical protein